MHLPVAMATVLAACALAACGGGDQGEATGPWMRAEIAGPELIVYVSDADDFIGVEDPERVKIYCQDPAGIVVLRRTQPWPFTDTDGGTVAPHVHEPLRDVRPAELATCSLRGAGPVISVTPSLAR